MTMIYIRPTSYNGSMITIGSVTLGLASLGAIAIALGWLIQLFSVRGHRRNYVRKPFVFLYVAGSAAILYEQFTGSFSLEFVIMAAGPAVALLLLFRMR